MENREQTQGDLYSKENLKNPKEINLITKKLMIHLSHFGTRIIKSVTIQV